MDNRIGKIRYIILGIVVGTLAGIVISLFRISANFLISYTEDIYAFLRSTDNPIWLIFWILFSIFLGGIIIWLINSEPDIQGSVQNIQGHIQGLFKMDWLSVLIKKFIGGVISLGSAMAVGREGPSIQIGSVVGLGVDSFLGRSRADENLLLSAGASAGLAAAFNTPVAAVLLIIEEVYHKFSESLFLVTLTASVAGNFVSYNVFGVKPIIDLDVLAEFPLDQYIYLVILGIIMGIAGFIFQEVFLRVPSWYRKLPLPNYLIPIFSFLVVIPFGLFAPNLLGDGTNLIFEIQDGWYTLGAIALICFLRFVFIQASYGAGAPGGFFLPTLTLGALVGAVFGTALHNYLSVEQFLIMNFMVYAMAGLLTSVTNATLTSVVLLLELTESVTHIMPLAIVCLLSFSTARLLKSDPIYEVLLMRKIRLPYSALKGSISESELIVESNSRLDNMVVRDLNMPAPSHITKINRDHREFIPKANTIIKANDLITFQADIAISSDAIHYLEDLNKTQDSYQDIKDKSFSSES